MGFLDSLFTKASRRGAGIFYSFTLVWGDGTICWSAVLRALMLWFHGLPRLKVQLMLQKVGVLTQVRCAMIHTRLVNSIG